METGVYPVYNTKFKIGIKGKTSIAAEMATIADMESFSMSIDGTTEKWTPMTTDGWARALMTGKAFSISLKGKRNIGDPGNDYVAATTWKDGLQCSTKGEIEFPDGSKLTFDCALDVKNAGGGDSTNVAPLEFDMVGDGKPVYTPAIATSVLALVSSNPVEGATGVIVGIQPTLTFNNRIESYNSIVFLDETDNSLVTSTMSLDATGKILTIVPGTSLEVANTYDIVLSGVTDIYGQVLAQRIIKFTTVTS